jgi:hypothetical protein
LASFTWHIGRSGGGEEGKKKGQKSSEKKRVRKAILLKRFLFLFILVVSYSASSAIQRYESFRDIFDTISICFMLIKVSSSSPSPLSPMLF